MLALVLQNMLNDKRGAYISVLDGPMDQIFTI